MQLYMSKSHGSAVTVSDLWRSANRAEMYTDNERSRRSRYADVSHTLTLNGYGSDTTRSNRRPNTRDDYVRRNYYAATWDQWGVFLSNLFFLDPAMKVGGYKHPYYDGVDDFHRATGDRFKRVFSMEGLVEGDLRRGVPPHADHHFRYDPALGGFTVHVRRCTKRSGDVQCDAVQVRG